MAIGCSLLLLYLVARLTIGVQRTRAALARVGVRLKRFVRAVPEILIRPYLLGGRRFLCSRYSTKPKQASAAKNRIQRKLKGLPGVSSLEGTATSDLVVKKKNAIRAPIGAKMQPTIPTGVADGLGRSKS